MSSGTVVVASAVGVVTGIATAWLIALIHEATSGAESARLAWSFVALCAVVLVTRVVSSLLLVQLSQRAVHDLRLRLSRQILAVPLRKLETLGASRLLVVLTEDITVLTSALPVIPVMATNFAIVASCFVYLGYLSLKALVAVALFTAFGIACYQFPIAYGTRMFERLRNEHDALFKHFRTLTHGIKELKLSPHRRAQFFESELGPTAAKLRSGGLRAHAVFIGADSWGNLLFFVSIALVLFGGGPLLDIDARVAGGYTLTILAMMSPLQGILALLPALSEAQASLRKIQATSASLDGAAEPLDMPAAGGVSSIELVAITHAYESFTLGPIDLVLRPGELVFVVGGNGSGKSTLAKLLTGLYAPSQGHIVWNGEAVEGSRWDAYRQQFSAVFSDFHLFEDLSSRGEDVDRRARDVLAMLQLAHKVEIKDGVLSTIDLSQGQRRRLALLSACIEDRPVYVFDEWAADQDPIFKELFYREILPSLRARGKVVFVISHDDRYFDGADRLYKLEDGKLVASR